jgi:hypothetical protein
MYRWKAVTVRFPALLLAGWLMYSCSYAQAPDNGNSHKRIRITVGGGWADYDMKRISGSYPVSEGHYWPSERWKHNRISDGAGAFLEAGYVLWKRLSVSAGVLHLVGETNDIYEEQAFLDDYDNRDNSDLDGNRFRASLLSPYAGIQYTYPFKSIEVFAAFSISYVFANATYSDILLDYDPPSILWQPVDFHSRGIGYLTGVGVSYGISRMIFVNSETGYRLLKTGDLEDDDGRTWQGMNLDFSGPYISMGLSFRL